MSKITFTIIKTQIITVELDTKDVVASENWEEASGKAITALVTHDYTDGGYIKAIEPGNFLDPIQTVTLQLAKEAAGLQFMPDHCPRDAKAYDQGVLYISEEDKDEYGAARNCSCSWCNVKRENERSRLKKLAQDKALYIEYKQLGRY